MAKRRKLRIRKVHLGATFLLVLYFLLGNTVLVSYVNHPNVLVSIGAPMLYGAVASIFFLYLFSHDDFFHFAKKIEEKQMGREKKLAKHFAGLGRISASFVIAIVGGPILGALAFRLLLRRAASSYILLLIANIPSTLFTLAVAKGLISIASFV